jgi:hypothetical protein
LISITKAFRGLYRLCQCGCGKLIKIVTKNYQIRKFIVGHTGKLNKGQNNGQYKSGRYFHKSSGYWYLTMMYDHPDSDGRGRIAEHIYNYTMFNKCCMLPWAIVHHIDENTDNNMPWNLQGMMRSDHTIFHETIEMDGRRCSKCGTDKTYIRTKKMGKRPLWKTDGKGNILCTKCENKIRWRLKNSIQASETLLHTY